MYMNLGLGVSSRRRRSTFSAAYGADPLAVTTSEKAYPRGLPPDADITVSSGAEYRLDGGLWTSDQGIWGTSSFIEVRGSSNAEYGLAVIHTVTIGVLALEFTIWTKDASTLFMYDELEMTDNLEMQ